MDFSKNNEHEAIINRVPDVGYCRRPTGGISLLHADLGRDLIDVKRIRKMGRTAVDSNARCVVRPLTTARGSYLDARLAEALNSYLPSEQARS